ncbi:MAG: hypothetical protein QNJ11_05850 [Woeseiaceae bacterium]|nr:hypothetical protein [Woeseiaceae bacterium]
MNSDVSRIHTREEIDSELKIVDYVAGRLDHQQAAAFEDQLEADPGLAALVEEERALRGMLTMVETGEVPAASAFEGVAAQLNGERRRWSPMPAIAAGIVAVVAVAFLMQVPDDSKPGRDGFETLSSDGAQAVDSGNRVRVVFAEGVDAARREAAAASFGFRIVSGPGPGGTFVVETAETIGREQLLKWREDARIELAEPVRYD